MARIFATLGGVEFEVPAMEEMADTIAWEYKQQETVAEKAVIQFAGAKARTMSLKAHLHATFCNPETRKKDFEDKAKLIAPLPLILANGKLIGYFVITEIATTLTKTDYLGNIIACELALKLTEAEAGADGAGISPVSKPIAGVAAGAPKLITPVSNLDPARAIGNVMQQAKAKVNGIPPVSAVLRKVNA